MRWEIEPDVEIQVVIGAAGPFDNLLTPPIFDVTDKVRGDVGITIKRGRSDEFSAFQAGECSFTLKNDGREFDPSNVSSPYIDILRPSRAVAVDARYGGVTYRLFLGYVDGWPRSWTSTTGSVRVTAHDQIATMARTATSPSLGGLILDHPHEGRLDYGRLAGDLPQQLSGERILSLLQLAGFGSTAEALGIAVGLTEVAAVEPDGNVLGLVQDAATAEGGFFFVDREGVIRFLDRHSRFLDPRLAEVQAVFTDSQYADLEVDHNLVQVWNDVTFARPGGADQRVVDDTSVRQYGYLSRRQEIPVVSDPEAAARAEFWVDRYGFPQDRPAPIVVNPRRDMPALFPKVAGAELLDRIQVERTPLGVAPTETYTGLVESVEHRITNESWTSTFASSPIDVSEGADFMVLNDLTLGQINTHTLAY